MDDTIFEICKPVFFWAPVCLFILTVVKLIIDLDFYILLLAVVVPVELPCGPLHEQGGLPVGRVLFW